MAKIKERKSESWKPGILQDDGFISKNKKRKEKRMSLNLSAKKIDTEEFIPIKKSTFSPFNKGKKNVEQNSKQTPNKFLSPALNKQKQTPKKKENGQQFTPKGKKDSFVSTPGAKKLGIGNVSKPDTPKNAGTPKKQNAGTPKKQNDIFNKLPIGNISKPNTPKNAGTPKKQNDMLNKLPIANAFKPNTPKNTGTPKKQNDMLNKLPIANAFKPNTPKNAGTPKKQNDVSSKLGIKKKAQEYIDSEASEGEEPITDKNVKPYVKGESKRKKSISFKFDDVKDNDSDSDEDDEYASFDDSDEDSDEAAEGKDFIDEEASEGEETDDEDDEDDDDDEELESSGDFKDFIIKDDENDESDEEDESDDESSDEEDTKPQIKQEKLTIKKEKPQIKKEPPVVKTEKKNEPIVTNGTKKVKTEKPETKIKQETESKMKKPKVEAKVTEKKPKEIKNSVEKPVSTEAPAVISNYVGFVRELPKTVTDEEIRAQLTTAINAKNIISVTIKKNHKKKNAQCLLYLSDEDTLEKILNKQFTIGDSKFKVYKARENPKPVRDKPVAFLPRVPLTIVNDKIKAAIESDIGPGKIVELKSKKVAEKFQTRNILLTVTDEETLKKIIYKGGYVVDGTEIVVRQAYESGFKVPVYKVVFSEIPENTTEPILKKAIEAALGKGTVVHVKFSFRKNSYAFVTLKTEEAQKKALQVGNDISIQNSKLKVLEFRPRLPRKRPLPKQNEADAKKQKTIETPPSPGTPAESKKAKKQKLQKSPQNAQKANVPNSPPNDKQQKKKKTKNAQVATPDKKADLSKKIELKKAAKLKQKKFKKQKTAD